MPSGQLDSKERLDALWTRMPEASHWPKPMSSARGEAAPMRPATPRGADGDTVRSTRVSSRGSWWRSAMRFVRSAAVGLALICAAPITVIAVRGDSLLLLFTDRGDEVSHYALSEQMRYFAAPVNPEISERQAGEALHRLQAMPSSEAFPVQPQTNTLSLAWDGEPSNEEPTVRAARAMLLRSSTVIVDAYEGFAASDVETLRIMAASPVWHSIDQLAGAARVDFLGSQFVVPFDPDAWAVGMPIQRMSRTTDIAKAGVARAAYYVALKQPALAEQALRSIVSYGLVFIDNGTNAIDGVIGRAVLNIARDGFLQLRMVIEAERDEASRVFGTSFDEDVFAVAVPEPSGARVSRSASDAPARPALKMRAEMLARATNPSVPRPLRYEALWRLSLSSCGTVRGALAGPPDDVRDAFDNARTTLARTPADRAYLDLLYRSGNQVPAEAVDARALSHRLLVGAATVASTVLQNPRVLSCTRMMTVFTRSEP